MIAGLATNGRSKGIPMLAFQDSLVMSEVHDWVDLLQPFHESNSEKAISSVDFDSDLEGDAEPEEYPDISLSPGTRRYRAVGETGTNTK